MTSAKPVKHAWKRQTAVFSRWIHIYLSMVSFGVLFFFAVTGLTLNHTEWFAKQQRTTQFKGRLNTAWTTAPQVPKLEIVEELRRVHGVKSAVSDFRADDTQLTVSFKGPGYSADAFIDRPTGAYDLTETRNGFWAVMNDLHKGRDSGRAWAIMIDVSAVLMAIVSLSGIILICFLQKRRFSGLVLAAIGGVLTYAVYLAYVP